MLTPPHRIAAFHLRRRFVTDEKGDVMRTKRTPPERNVMTSIYYMLTKVGRCKLDPGLKAPGFNRST